MVGSNGLSNVTAKPVGVGNKPVTIRPRTAMAALTPFMPLAVSVAAMRLIAACRQGRAEDAAAAAERAVGRQRGGAVAAGRSGPCRYRSGAVLP